MNTPSTSVSAGLGGFLAFFILALALWLLMRNMNARMRRMAYREEFERKRSAAARPGNDPADGPRQPPVPGSDEAPFEVSPGDPTPTGGIALGGTASGGAATDLTRTEGTALGETVSGGAATDLTRTEGTAGDGVSSDGTVTEESAGDGSSRHGTASDGSSGARR